MEQRDYLLREIEKIGLILRAILGTLFNKTENLAIGIENPFEQTKELLIYEIGFDLDTFLTLDEPATKEYLSGFDGFNPSNLELLAEILYNSGLSGKAENNKIYLEKALQLYEMCSNIDKTYSGPRESRITEIKSML